MYLANRARPAYNLIMRSYELRITQPLFIAKRIFESKAG